LISLHPQGKDPEEVSEHEERIEEFFTTAFLGIKDYK